MNISAILQRRSETPILIVLRDGELTAHLKRSLKEIGFNNVSSTNNHGQGLERMKGRNFSLVFFDAVETNMQAVHFVKSVRQFEKEALLIALSARPSIDDVFENLRAGARSFIVIPFATDILEDVIIKAVEGPPFSEAVFEATDRNTALVNIVLNDLDSLTVSMRHLRAFPGAINDVDHFRAALEDSMKLARTFAEGGDIALIERIIDTCISRATFGATRLGRVRRRLQRKRNRAQTATKRFKVTRAA
ncbi:MAG: response regulator [Bdellovibrionota bacterium]